MRFDARTLSTIALLFACAPLAACGGEEKGGNAVQMKDLEVVDGTATDAMTDLDGVQSEGTSVSMPGGNSSRAAPRKDSEAAAEPAAKESEVVADQ